MFVLFDETIDPELSIDRAIQNYRLLGYSSSRKYLKTKNYYLCDGKI